MLTRRTVESSDLLRVSESVREKTSISDLLLNDLKLSVSQST